MKRLENDQPETQGTSTSFPKLFWTGVLLFTTNVVVAGLIVVSPNLAVDMYGAPIVETNSPTDKPSPFVQLVSDKQIKVRLADHLTPVVFEQPTQDFQIPRATQRDLYQPAVYKYSAPANATNLNLPRMTATHNVSGSEREQKQIVTN